MEIPGQDKSEKNYLETLPYQGEGKANKQKNPNQQWKRSYTDYSWKKRNWNNEHEGCKKYTNII